MEKEAMLYRPAGDDKVHCYLCHHHCKIFDSKFGVCDMRKNKGGRLYTHAYGELIAANIDPIEKKPLYHFSARHDVVFNRHHGVQLSLRFLSKLADLPGIKEKRHRFAWLPSYALRHC